ncbi:class I SAM-dependent methyltransferase [Zhouia amylolytica]|uniref:SAM-dependent methyltransferase n=1 Tax=Zhouia amylolytica AD3 TaxID=1286632 RepID=W2UJD2_9FLAO|nr:class I SAM-dependent methyltransferase [Zhouia amylolytica]ETN94069.1 SAM-dependent methyltransferase [Zhouia amylolytica AD3]
MTKTKYLSCKDYTVTGENFDLVYDEDYDMLITHPQPDPEKLPAYYQSDEYISHTDAAKTILDKLYQRVKKINLNKKVQYINTTNPKKGLLLDIGAGTGDFLLYAQKLGWEVQGIEPNKKARILAKEKGISIAEKLTIEKTKYDVITMWHVLEHVPNLKEQIQQLSALLSDDGTIFIAVPNYKSYDAKYYEEHWAAYDVPRHLWHFSRKSISKLFKEQNMRVVKILPMVFDSFYVSLLSEKYKGSKMRFIKAFTRGTISNLKAKQTGEYSSLIYVIKKAH